MPPPRLAVDGALRFGTLSKLMRMPMARDITRPAKAAPPTSLMAIALGAAAFGAVAIGALAIGRLAIGRLVIKRAHFRTLEVDELTVRKLRVVERDVGKAD